MLIHTGEKPFKCYECDGRFTKMGNLNKHMLIHTGKRPFKCKVCGRRFKVSCDLKKHMLVHTGDYNKCKVCDSKFSQSEQAHVDSYGRQIIHV